jgi:hypothetical protein
MRVSGRQSCYALVCALLLFLLNAILIRELFAVEYLDQMGSIEGAYIGISRYMLANWRDLSWFPLWYGGIPFQNTYPPLLHAVVAMVSWIFGSSPAWAHHAVSAAIYALGGAAVLWLAYSLSRNWRTAVLTGLLYSVFSPSPYLVTAIRQDLGGVLYPRRFQNLIQYGEGPHLLALLLIPAALALLHRALERRGPINYSLAALACAAVALTNFLGLFALVAMAGCYLLSREFRPADWARSAAIGGGAYALACPWLPPSTLLAVRTNAQWVGGVYSMGWRQAGWLVAGIAAILLAARLLMAAGAARDLRFWTLASLAFCWIALPAFWFHSYALPQPERYQLEMEMALCGLGATLASRRRASVAAMIALCVFAGIGTRRYAREHVHSIDITKTVEYRMARWLETNARAERVFLPGSAYIWLNAFSTQPQLGGGFDQGITNQLLPAVFFQTFSGLNAGDREGQITVSLLKAFGVHEVAVGGPASREFYRPYRNPDKFKGVLPEVWREGDDVIYRIPHRSASLAHVMRRGDLPQPLPDVTRVEGLARYLAALDNSAFPETEIIEERPGAFSVAAQLHREQILSIQMSYHRGWTARAGGREVPIRPDALGMTVAEPFCEGRCMVEFEYTGGAEMFAAKAARAAAVFGGILWIIAASLKGLTALGSLDREKSRSTNRKV